MKAKVHKSKALEAFLRMWDVIFEDDDINEVVITLKYPLSPNDIEFIEKAYNRANSEFRLSIQALQGTSYKVTIDYIG